MKNVSQFFRTTAVNKLEFGEAHIEEVLNEVGASGMIHRSLRTAEVSSTEGRKLS